MNYYIQGDKDKAEQIKAAFEKLGYDVSGFDMCNDNILFFTYKLQGGGKVISTTNANLYTADIIKTHPDYKELELSVEPKFNVGDWIANDYCAGKVIALTDDAYLLDSGQGIPFSCEHNAHLWTIEDAKDGDILATDNGWTCIFQAFDGCGFSSYCFMDSQRWFCESGSEVHTPDSRINGKIHPATKEQRDLLFAEMKEAGYKWDADKKELRKIQPHYGISNFHAGMPVLVRDENGGQWIYTTYSHYDSSREYKFMTSACESFVQCIPFEGNEHLIGTIDKCDKQYINW